MFTDIGKNPVVIDIGAYRGEVSKRLCEYIRGKPNLFYLIEPNPINFIYLTEIMPEYSIRNIAIGDHDGTEQFFYVEDFLNASSFYREMPEGKGKEAKEITVNTLTLDSFIEQEGINKIDLIKINCEGGEFKIFNAGLKFLDITKYIQISFHGKREVFNQKVDEKVLINKLLMDRGYRFVDGVLPEKLGKGNPKSHELQVWKRDDIHSCE